MLGTSGEVVAACFAGERKDRECASVASHADIGVESIAKLMRLHQARVNTWRRLRTSVAGFGFPGIASGLRPVAV